MAKRKKSVKKRHKKNSYSKKQKSFLWFLVIIVILAPLSYITYNYIEKNLKVKKKPKKKAYLDKKILEKMNKMLQVERKKVDILKEELQNRKNRKKIIKTDTNKTTILKNKYSSEAIDYKKSLDIETKKSNKTNKHKIIVKSKKPLLAIVMDDVSFQNEANKIKKLPFKITPSIFPPTKIHPNTPNIAKEFSFYMIHLPLQAYNYPHPEPHTLTTSSSLSQIRKRIKKIKQWFPKDRFINNHTGSKFTSNYNAMMKLFEALRENKMVFIDSKTTAKTVALKVAKNFNEKLLSRNVFLDNKPDITYIKKQLKKAVKIAKKNGYAIAICHPHIQTFKALQSSSDILKSVKVVYVKDIYENSSYSSK